MQEKSSKVFTFEREKISEENFECEKAILRNE